MLGRRRRRESAVPGRAALGADRSPLEKEQSRSTCPGPRREGNNWAPKAFYSRILSRLIIVHVKGYRFDDLIRV